MTAALSERRATEPSFSFSKDGVHPDALGHAVIARAYLLGCGYSEAVAKQPLAFARGERAEFIALVRARGTLLKDGWLTATGHKRPEMAVGLPLAEAQERAAQIDASIRNLISGSPARTP